MLEPGAEAEPAHSLERLNTIPETKEYTRIASKIGLKQLETLPVLEEARWFGRELDDADAADLAGMLQAAAPLPCLKCAMDLGLTRTTRATPRPLSCPKYATPLGRL